MRIIMNKPVILTGLRANNDLHIGNYFGGLLPLVDMAINRSDDYQVNIFVPDLHSFTTPIDHAHLQPQIMQNLRVYVAAGLPLATSRVVQSESCWRAFMKSSLTRTEWLAFWKNTDP